jgi:toxin YoeB
MRRVIFEADAFEDFTAWAIYDKQIYAKIIRLIKDIKRSAFTGLGKPEPLRHELRGYWSRRIND